MHTAEEIELRALVEKLAPADLPVAAAVLLEAWCRSRGVMHDSMYEFYRIVTEHQSGDLRAQLDLMGATYRFGQLIGPEPDPSGQLD